MRFKVIYSTMANTTGAIMRLTNSKQLRFVNYIQEEVTLATKSINEDLLTQ